MKRLCILMSVALLIGFGLPTVSVIACPGGGGDGDVCPGGGGDGD